MTGYLGFDRPCRNGCGWQLPIEALVCFCAEPVVERIPFFDAVQCGVCFRPFRHLLPFAEVAG